MLSPPLNMNEKMICIANINWYYVLTALLSILFVFTMFNHLWCAHCIEIRVWKLMNNWRFRLHVSLFSFCPAKKGLESHGLWMCTGCMCWNHKYLWMIVQAEHPTLSDRFSLNPMPGQIYFIRAAEAFGFFPEHVNFTLLIQYLSDLDNGPYWSWTDPCWPVTFNGGENLGWKDWQSLMA